MTGLILAAGKGSRLNEITENTPKSLLELSKNFTLLDYNLRMLESIKVTRIIIVTGFQYEQIEQKAKEYSHLNIEIIFNPFWDKCNVLGSLYMALPVINDDFLFLHADTLVDKSVWKKLIQSNGDIILPYQKKKCGEEEMKVSHNKSGQLLEISKEIDVEKSDGEFLGIAKFSNSIIHYIFTVAKKLFSEKGLNLYMEEAVQKAVNDKKEISTFDIADAKFIEVDFVDDLVEARKVFGKKAG